MISLVGIGCFLLAAWRAWRVRRDLASGETQWESAFFGRRERILWAQTPLKFWCAILVNTIIVLLITLVAASVMRVGAFSVK